MSTPAQIKANQENAQHSTGPKTDEGKSRSSRNNLKFGVHSTARLLPGEDEGQLDILAQAMLKDFNPNNVTETELVNQLIDIQWRLRRLSSREADILAADDLDCKALNTVSLVMSRAKRQFSKTLEEFRTLHRQSNERLNSQISEAAAVVEADAILNRPSTFDEFGFEFTRAQFDRWTARENALRECRNIVSDNHPPYGFKYEEEETEGELEQAA